MNKPPTLPATGQTIDISDSHYADVLRACYAFNEAYLSSGSNDDLKRWVEADRERSRILDARQRAKMVRS